MSKTNKKENIEKDEQTKSNSIQGSENTQEASIDIKSGTTKPSDSGRADGISNANTTKKPEQKADTRLSKPIIGYKLTKEEAEELDIFTKMGAPVPNKSQDTVIVGHNLETKETTLQELVSISETVKVTIGRLITIPLVEGNEPKLYL